MPCGTGAIFISDRRDSKSTTLRSRVSNQPSGLLLSARVPIFRNVYRGCWIRRDSKSTTLRSRVSNQPSGLLLSARVPIFRNVYRGCWIRRDSKSTTLRSRVSNQPSGLLLSARVPIFRNVYRGCWIRRDSKRAATTAACPLPFYCSTLLSRMRSLSRVLPAFSRNFSSRSSTVILLRSSPFTSNTMRPLSIIRVRLPSSNA